MSEPLSREELCNYAYIPQDKRLVETALHYLAHVEKLEREIERLREFRKAPDTQWRICCDSRSPGPHTSLCTTEAKEAQPFEPLSREELEGAPWASGLADIQCEAFRQTALHYLVRVEELERRCEDLEEGNWPWEWVIATRERERWKEAEARVEELGQQLKNARGACDEWALRYAAAQGRVEKLEREIERLRADVEAWRQAWNEGVPLAGSQPDTKEEDGR